MFAVLVLGLSFFTAALLIVAGIALVDVFFYGSERNAAEDARRREWKPPVIHDDELTQWATGATAARVRRQLESRGPNFHGASLAAEVRDGLNYALRCGEESPGATTAHDCPGCSRKVIAVSAPEVLEIAEVIHCRHPENLPEVTRNAHRNVRDAAHLDAERHDAAQFVCPLLGKHDVCLAEEARPIQCRGWTHASARSSIGGEADGFAGALSRGVAAGLADELQANGFDGNRYELNSALTVALEMAEVNEAWVHGRPVFAECRKV